MAHWKLKIDKQFADEIVLGNKTFEARKEEDKVFQRGDTVEFDVNRQNRYIPEEHPISGNVYEITYVLHGWGIEEGTCVFSFKEHDIDDPEEMNMAALKDIKAHCKSTKCEDCFFYSGDNYDFCNISELPSNWKI